MKRLGWCVVVSLSFLGSIAEDASVKSPEKEIESIEKDEFLRKSPTRFDVAARKIAGIYSTKESDTKMREYSEFINSAWNKLYKDSLGHVSKWSGKYLKQYIEKYNTLFYPFGGPDVSYAISFFPHAKRYILVGLEPLGNFDQIEENLKKAETFDSIRIAFSHYLRKGYFVTSEMQTQLSNKTLKGGLNLILVALPKLGFSIQKIENLFIDPNGKVVKFCSDGISCIRIVCEKNSQKKEIYYLKADLSNGNNQVDYLLKFVNKFEFSTLIKSASYALHDRNFSKTRSFILDNTNCILQDDTGVPFNFFRQNWDIHIFGTYTKPTLPTFYPYKQDSLSEYYSNYKAEAIPFPIGYGYIKHTPNLVLVVSLKKIVEHQLDKLRQRLKQKKCNCYNKNTKES